MHALIVRKFQAYCLVGRFDKVQFLDFDIVPVRNMDYLFTLLPPPLTDAFGAGILEPAQAGWILLTPNWSTYQTVMAPVKVKGLNMVTATDKELGWGERITNWTTLFKHPEIRSGWTYGAWFMDQGLLYYYARFKAAETCAIFYNDHYETWPPPTRLGNETYQEPRMHTLPKLPYADAPRFLFRALRPDYEHYTGVRKPWLSKLGPPQDWLQKVEALRNSTSSHRSHFLNVSFPIGKFQHW